jgi:hypothetical protein
MHNTYMQKSMVAGTHFLQATTNFVERKNNINRTFEHEKLRKYCK